MKFLKILSCFIIVSAFSPRSMAEGACEIENISAGMLAPMTGENFFSINKL